MGAVVEVVEDIGSGIGDIVEDVGSGIGDVVESVGDVVSDVVETAGSIVEQAGEIVVNTVEAALSDPIGTAAKAAAIITQQYYLLPVISAASVVANGGSIEDAVKAGAIAYVAQGVAQNSLVEQVIVTARKRSEPATAVPMSFNVIDATTIDTFRIRNLADLAPPCTQRCPLRGFPRRWHSYLDYPRRGLAGFQQQQHASRCRPC